MESVVERNLFTGYSIGEQDPVSVSHLQFADDILLLGEAASALCCKVGKIPFLYLGLSIGGDPRRLGFWEPVLARLKNKLSGWKSRFLSFGGRLILLNWKSICLSKEYGGLGVRKLREFNLSLLGRLRVGGRRGSVWWREIASIREGGERFGRLFELAETKLRTVTEMCSLGWGADGEAWVWKRQLREEEMLGECQSLLLNLSLQVQSSDRWQWQPDPNTGYTVTTKANLVTRDILSPTAHLCVSGCGAVETAHHLFISCSTFGSFWALVSSWIGITSVDSISLRDPFVQFSVGGSRACRSFLQLIWLTCVWVVWTERNHRLFRGSACSSHHLLDKIKLFSFRWLKTKSATLASNYHSWWSSPLLCLSLV
ncbi:hypothetical protein TSUD_28100 [Trifolium subterraneum]|uniref:Reverse transcriptase zinc-binding domain-containing protein n=1 Tax=Trifolium subterraneum TaxID=3900 RepID=A0A2Z6N6T8_TRISU|nr:hypothetical protein TSUD_28100 [Trifolium subterraneum]